MTVQKGRGGAGRRASPSVQPQPVRRPRSQVNRPRRRPVGAAMVTAPERPTPCGGEAERAKGFGGCRRAGGAGQEAVGEERRHTRRSEGRRARRAGRKRAPLRWC